MESLGESFFVDLNYDESLIGHPLLDVQLLLLFAGANPKEKIFANALKPTVRRWLTGFLTAKKIFVHLFDENQNAMNLSKLRPLRPC